ncbi:MAG: PilZ domain-containing protein [Polyangia bacterium]
MLRIVSALTPELALSLERDLLRRADLHLIDVTTIEQLVAAAREGAHLCLVEPLLPDGNARDVLDELAALDERVPTVLVASPEARDELGEQGFAAVIELPLSGGAFDDVLGRIIDTPRRRALRQPVAARIADIDGTRIGRSLDLSMGGAALRTRRGLTVGEALAITVELPGREPLAVRSKVVRAVGERAAISFEDASDTLRIALTNVLAPVGAVEGLSFRPRPDLGARAAALGGTLVEGPALAALSTFFAGQGDTTLVVRDLMRFDDAMLDRFVTLRQALDELGTLTLRACPSWLGALASRLPSLLGDRARIGTLAVALRCDTCEDAYEEELPVTDKRATSTMLEAGRPCAVCGGTLRPCVPTNALLAFL